MEKTTGTIIAPWYITRDWAIAHPEYVIIYGNAVHSSGSQLGMPAVLHDLPNCFPISVRFKLCRDDSAYFSDARFEECTNEIFWSFGNLPIDDRPIIPLRKIGQGFAELPIRAPRVFSYLQRKLKNDTSTVKYKQ
jgi:hypothetical protein